MASLYEESTEQAESLIESAFEQVRHVMTIKSDSLTQFPDPVAGEPEPSEFLESANPGDGEGTDLPTTPADSIQPMQPEQSADPVLLDAENDSEERPMSTCRR